MGKLDSIKEALRNPRDPSKQHRYVIRLVHAIQFLLLMVFVPAVLVLYCCIAEGLLFLLLGIVPDPLLPRVFVTSLAFGVPSFMCLVLLSNYGDYNSDGEYVPMVPERDDW